MASLVIDFHIHLIKYLQPTKSLDKLNLSFFGTMEKLQAAELYYARPENMVRMLKEQGVDYGIIIAEYAPLTTGIATNEMVAEFCAGHKELIPFCSFNPQTETNTAPLLRELCGQQGFKGLKLYPTYNHFYPNEPKIYPLYAAAQEMGIPVLFHTGSSVFQNSRMKYGNPILYDDVAADFPDLKIIMAHGGRGPWYDEAMTMIRLHPNVYVDLSGLPVRKWLQFFPELDRFAHKFVFGTDWPQIEPVESIRRLAQLDLSEKAKAQILGENAANLLGL
jgi:predicted TIM-barrel fold metal-dependent hydrolase